MSDTPSPASKPTVPQAQATPLAPATGRALDPFTALRRQMDRLFDDFGFGNWPALGRGFLTPEFDRPNRQWLGEHWGATDVSETDTAYRITIELPGCAEQDLDVSVANGTLTVKGEKKQEQKDEKEQFHSVGRRYGAFQQTFRLPDTVDAAKVAAAFKNGVLDLTLPKADTARAQVRKVPVGSP